MKDFGNLDGELTEDFLNIGGEVPVGMVAESAIQNVYPSLNEDLSAFDDYYSASGDRKKRREEKRARKSAKKDTRQKMREAIVSGKLAKNEERLSRAELNKGLGTEKESDVELAKALSESVKDDSSKKEKKPMSTTTKILIGVGAALLIGGIAFLVLRKKSN